MKTVDLLVIDDHAPKVTLSANRWRGSVPPRSVMLWLEHTLVVRRGPAGWQDGLLGLATDHWGKGARAREAVLLPKVDRNEAGIIKLPARPRPRESR